MTWLIDGTTAAISLSMVYQAYRCYNWRAPESWEPYRLAMSEEAKAFASRAGVKKDVKFYSFDLGHEMPACSFGNQLSEVSEVAVVIHPSYLPKEDSSQELSPAMNVAIRHEYVHVTHNDMFARSAVRAAASVGSAVLGVFIVSSLSILLLTVITTIGTHILYSRFIENRADEIAMQNSSEEELQASLCLLNLHINAGVEARTKNLLARMLISPEGNRRFEVIHQSLTSRAKRVEYHLKKAHA